MNEIKLDTLDIALVLVYLVGVVALGLWRSHGLKTSKEFFLAGKTLPWWAVGMSLVVSDIGAKDMVGLAGDGYRFGIVMMNFDFIGCIFPMLIAAFLFMPFFWMAGVYTVPEYLGRRYNAIVRVFFAVVWVVFMVCTLGVIFVSAAAMFEALLGWSFWLSVILTAGLVGLYTTVGGLKAVVFTDVISCVVLIGGAALICGLGLIKVGGWTGLQETIGQMDWTADHFKLLPPADHAEYPWPAVLLGLGLVQGPAYWLGNQAIVQRTLGARSQNEARASYVFAATIKLFFPILLVVPGLIGVALFKDKLGAPVEGFEGNAVLPMLVLELLPTGVLGIVIGAFLAGVLSNLDSYVNSASTLLVSDIYRPYLNRGASDHHCLRLAQALVVVLLIGGVGISYPIYRGFDSVFEAFQTVMTFFMGPMLVLLLLGMLLRRVTQWGGMAGLVVGVGTAVLLHIARAGLICGFEIDLPLFYVPWWSFVAALVTTLLVSFITRPYDDDRLRGLVCWLPIKEQST